MLCGVSWIAIDVFVEWRLSQDLSLQVETLYYHWTQGCHYVRSEAWNGFALAWWFCMLAGHLSFTGLVITWWCNNNSGFLNLDPTVQVMHGFIWCANSCYIPVLTWLCGMFYGLQQGLASVYCSADLIGSFVCISSCSHALFDVGLIVLLAWCMLVLASMECLYVAGCCVELRCCLGCCCMLQDMVAGDAAEGIALVHVIPCIGFVGKIKPMCWTYLAAGSRDLSTAGSYDGPITSMYVVHS